MTIVEAAGAVTGGIDTHGEVHVAAALDEVGGLLGTQSFGADPEGYSALLTWLESFGYIGKVGVEGTGSYGAGIARFLARAGVRVVEVDRQNRQARRQTGKSDPSTSWPPSPGPMTAKRRRSPRFFQGAGQMRCSAPLAPEQTQGLPISKPPSVAARPGGLRPTRSPDVVTAATKAAPSSPAHRAAHRGDLRSRRHAAISPLLRAADTQAALCTQAPGNDTDRPTAASTRAPPL